MRYVDDIKKEALTVRLQLPSALTSIDNVMRKSDIVNTQNLDLENSKLFHQEALPHMKDKNVDVKSDNKVMNQDDIENREDALHDFAVDYT